jgi:cobalt-zinc-cadmium efflux system outer membrane protein
MDLSVSTRRRRVARVAAMALLGGAPSLFAPVSAVAAETPRAPDALQVALQNAWARHPQAAVVQATLDAATARADAASQPLHNPELELSADDEGTDRTATAGLGLTLDLSGKRRARSAVGRAELDAATAAASLQRRDFAQAWLDAWVALRAADRRVALGNQRTDLLARAADLAVRLFEVGDISSLDRDFALLARDEAGADQATRVAERAAATAAFHTLDRGPTVTLSIPFPDATVADAVVEIDALPELTIAHARAAAAEAQVIVAERERIVDPTLSVRGGRIELADGMRENTYGITLTVPLFVRNSYRAELAAAMADARAASADLERNRYELQARAVRAVTTHRAVREAWQRWSQSPGTDVEKRSALLERLWRAGELSTSDYLLQLEQTVDTALAGADLEARLWASFADYLAATGRLDAWLGFAPTKGE